AQPRSLQSATDRREPTRRKRARVPPAPRAQREPAAAGSNFGPTDPAASAVPPQKEAPGPDPPAAQPHRPRPDPTTPQLQEPTESPEQVPASNRSPRPS